MKIILRIVLALVLLVVLGVAGLFALYETNRIVIPDIDKAKVVETRAGPGLDPALAALASALVTIPHSAAVESLNVAVAAAPLLLERWRQRHGP